MLWKTSTRTLAREKSWVIVLAIVNQQAAKATWFQPGENSKSDKLLSVVRWNRVVRQDRKISAKLLDCHRYFVGWLTLTCEILYLCSPWLFLCNHVHWECMRQWANCVVVVYSQYLLLFLATTAFFLPLSAYRLNSLAKSLSLYDMHLKPSIPRTISLADLHRLPLGRIIYKKELLHHKTKSEWRCSC